MKRKTKDGVEKKTKKRKCVVMEPIHINPKYLEETYEAKFKKGFDKTNGPFPHWQLRNFVENSGNAVEKVEEELQNLEDWQRKENDLYSLYQTNDLKSINPTAHPAIFSFRQFLYTEVKDWLQKVSGVELTEQVDCNGSCYARTDSLLPHNDLIETRRFAFVYYVTEANWNSEANGGDLQLFNHDKNLQPTTVAAQFAPLRNSLILFEVSQTSWHRVAEMISEEPRLSINGWFHSTRRIEPKKPTVENIQRFLPENKVKLGGVISKQFLSKERQNEVQETFSDNSELNLSGFLVKSIHDKIYSELISNPSCFKIVGPVSKRHVARLKDSESSNLKTTNRIIECLKSTNFARLAAKLTGVTVAGSQTSVKVSRVEHGTYWVLGDEDAEQSATDGYCLDVHLFVQKTAWEDEAGGELIYIAEEETEELLRISPSPNAASIVFREPGVISFLKYANCKSSEPFFLLTVSFYNVKVVDE
uniref:uS12 prolyl 3-hydroxylase n=1 Tax=Caenorhabditis tropicalis TaxID=1561998 RepID=A0A1I7TSM4_9PELO